MSTIKSSTEHLTLNADGVGKEIKFQANGVEKASISSAGAFTSTSIDATKLSGALPAIDGSALTGMPAGGKVLQVVSTNRYSTYASTSSAPQAFITQSITPISTSSKVLIMSQTSIGGSLHSEGFLTLSGGGTGSFIGDARGSRRRATTSIGNDYMHGTNQMGNIEVVPITYLDSPSTTSSISYSVNCWTNAGTVYINRDGEDPNSSEGFTATSSLTLMEIGV